MLLTAESGKTAEKEDIIFISSAISAFSAVKLKLGLFGFVFRRLQGMIFFIIPFQIDIYVHSSHSKIGFVFSTKVKSIKVQRHKGAKRLRKII